MNKNSVSWKRVLTLLTWSLHILAVTGVTALLFNNLQSVLSKPSTGEDFGFGLGILVILLVNMSVLGIFTLINFLTLAIIKPLKYFAIASVIGIVVNTIPFGFSIIALKPLLLFPNMSFLIQCYLASVAPIIIIFAIKIAVYCQSPKIDNNTHNGIPQNAS
jgi:hypothetical protein